MNYIGSGKIVWMMPTVIVPPGNSMLLFVTLEGVFIHWTGLDWTGLTLECLFHCRTEA